MKVVRKCRFYHMFDQHMIESALSKRAYICKAKRECHICVEPNYLFYLCACVATYEFSIESVRVRVLAVC